MHSNPLVYTERVGGSSPSPPTKDFHRFRWSLSIYMSKPTISMVVFLGALTAFGALSIDMYLPALPVIAEQFGAGHGVIELTLAAFVIGMALGQLFVGPLSDRIGRKPPLIAGICVYIIASILCAFTTSVEAMTGLRLLQGLGACAAMVVSRAIVRDRYDATQSAKMFSHIMLVFGLAPILAPLIGGYILVFSIWQTIFYVLAGFGVVVLLAVLFWMQESRGEGTATSARGEHPLRALKLLAGNRQLLGYMLAAGFNGSCLFVYISGSPGLLIGHYGVSPTTFGWLFAVNSIGMVVASQVNGVLLSHFPPEKIVKATCIYAALWSTGFLVLTLADIGGLWLFLVGIFGTVASFGFIFGNSTAGALDIDHDRAGSISALLGASGFAIGALVMSMGSLLADGTAVPMVAIMCGSLILSALSYLFLAIRSE